MRPTRYELWSLYFVSKEISGSHLGDCYKGPVKAATMEKMIPPQEILTKTGRNIPSGHLGAVSLHNLHRCDLLEVLSCKPHIILMSGYPPGNSPPLVEGTQHLESSCRC